MFFAITIVTIALHAIFFFRLATRVRLRSISRWKALGLYALVGLAPTVFFAGSFLILVGMEEVFSLAIISEGVGRGVPIFGGLLLLLWIFCCVVFMLYSIWARRSG